MGPEDTQQVKNLSKQLDSHAVLHHIEFFQVALYSFTVILQMISNFKKQINPK